MASKVEKVISFRTEGGQQVANEIGSFGDKMKKQTDEMIRSAESSSKSSEDLIKNLEREIALLEKKNALERNKKIKDIQSETAAYVKEKEGELAGLRTNPRGLVRGYDGTIREAFSRGYLNDSPTETERIIAGKRKGINEDIAAAKEGADEEVNQLIAEGETQSKLLRKLIEEYKAGVQRQIDAEKQISEEQVDEERFAGGGGPGGPGGGGPNRMGAGGGEDEEDDEEDKKRNWKEVMKGILAAGAVREVLSGLRRGGDAFLNAKSGDEFVEAELYTAIPFVGQGLAALNRRHLEQRQAREESLNLYKKTTGWDNYGDNFSDIGMGIDGVEGTKFAAQLARTRGFRGVMRRDSVDMFSLKQAYDIDENTIMGRAKVEKNLGSESISNSIIGLINTLKSNNQLGDDLSRLPKLIEIQNQLIEDGSKFSGVINDQQLARRIS